MFLRANVIHFVGKHSATLRHSAVLAAITSPLANLPTKLFIHGEVVRPSRAIRALACKRSSSWPTRR
jgi:hypothetical protein